MRDVNRTGLATAICLACVVLIALLFENFVLSLIIAATLCVGLLSHRASGSGSRIKTAKLLFLNAGVLALIFLLLREAMAKFAWRCPPELWPWLHRIYGVWWLSECVAIILVVIAGGLVTIELAGKIGDDGIQKRFQWSIIGAASLLIAVNIVHFLRPVSCSDCFFPYGLPFTLFTEGGFAGGRGFVWSGLVADVALVPAFATITTLMWHKIAK